MEKSSKANAWSTVPDDNSASETVTNYIIIPSQSKPTTPAFSNGSTSQTGGNRNDKQHMYVLDPDVAELLAEGLSMRYICDRLKKVCVDRFDKNVVYDRESGVIDAKLRVGAARIMITSMFTAQDDTTPLKNMHDSTSQKNEKIKSSRYWKYKKMNVLTSLGVMEPSYYLRQKEWLKDIIYTCKECNQIFSKDVNYLYLLHLLGHLQFVVYKDELADKNQHLLQRIMTDVNVVKYLEVHGLEMHLFHEVNQHCNCTVVSKLVMKESKPSYQTSRVVESTKEKDSYSKATNSTTAPDMENNSVDLVVLHAEFSEQDGFNEFERKYFGNKSCNPVPEAIQFLKYLKEQDKPFQCITCKSSFRLLKTFVIHLAQAHKKYITAYQAESLHKELLALSNKPTSSVKGKTPNGRYIKSTESECLQTAKATKSDKPTNKFKGTEVNSIKSTRDTPGALYYLNYQKMEEKRFQCKICMNSFRLRVTFFTHMAQVHQEFSPAADQVFSLKKDQSALSNNTELNLGQNYVGALSNKSDMGLTAMGELSPEPANHWKSTDDHGIKNSECLKTSKGASSHKPTYFLKGTNDNGIQVTDSPSCFKCKNQLVSNLFLNAHIKFKNSDTKCKVCPQRLATEYDLKQLVHTLRQINCEYCKRKLVSEENLKKRIETHSIETHPIETVLVKHFSCSQCSRVFMHKAALDMHVKNVHSIIKNKDGLFSCPFCDKKFKTKIRCQVHHAYERTIQEEKHKCEFCLRCFGNRLYLRNHERRHIAEDGRCCQCLVCWCVFVEREDLVAHVTSKHSDISQDKMKCSICPRSFKTSKSLRLHITQIHAKYKAIRYSKCQKEYSGQKLTCIQCKKIFNHQANFNKHMETHSNTTAPRTLFKCSQCVKQFQEKPALDRHVTEVHCLIKEFKDEPVQFSCTYCDMIFQEKPALDMHITEVHMINKHEYTQLSCTYCDMKFKTKSDLNKHTIDVHALKSTQKTFTCKQCKHNFITEEHLKKHMETHPAENVSIKLLKIHMETKSIDKHLRCSQCQKEFSSIIVLDNHIKLQHPFSVKCEVCEKLCATDFHLKQHQLVHGLCNKFSCLKCKRRFIDKAHLKRHLETHSSETFSVKLFSCQQCAKQFQEKPALDMHITKMQMINKHEYALLNCTHGDMKFKTISDWNTQTRVLHARESTLVHTHSKNFTCKQCKKNFISEEHLKKHMETHPAETVSVDLLKTPVETLSHETISVKLFSCTQCTEKCRNQPDLDMHIADMHSKDKDKDWLLSCDQKFITKSGWSERHVRNLRGVKFCTTCGKRYKSTQSLYRHIRLMHNERSAPVEKYKCEFCLRYFGTGFILRHHKKRHFCEDGRFQCLICWYKFEEKQQLMAHVTSEHSGFREKKTKCNICQRRFITRKSLRIHINRVHSKTKPLRCTQCKREFSSNIVLKFHINLRHPVKCDVCHKICATVSCLKKNQLVHTQKKNFCCKQCKKKIIPEENLKKHMETHSNENASIQLFSCPQCLKQFREKSALDRHVTELHNVIKYGEAVLSCTYCDDKFKTESGRNRHIRALHAKHGNKEHSVAQGTSEHMDIINQSSNIYDKQRRSKKIWYKHQRSKKKSRCQCDQCGVTLANKRMLGIHLRSQHPSDNTEEESASVICSDCGKSYPSKRQLIRHIHHMHTPSNFCVCHVCGKEMTCKEILARHLRTHEQPQHECGICKKKFRRSDYFANHQRMHSGLKQHICPICSKPCAFATGLKYHMKTHHTNW